MEIRMKRFVAINAILFLMVGTASYAGIDDQAENVSLIQLIATPERFSGKHVNVTGFLHLGYEDASLYWKKGDSLICPIFSRSCRMRGDAKTSALRAPGN